MFEVQHKNGSRTSQHETEDDARKQVVCQYGADVYVCETDRASGRLRVYASAPSFDDDFASPIARIVLPPAEEANPEPAKEEKQVHHAPQPHHHHKGNKK